MILQRTLDMKHQLAQGPGSWTNPLCILSQLSADPELLPLGSFWGSCVKCFTRANPTPNRQWQVHALCSGPSAALHPTSASTHGCTHLLWGKGTSGFSLRKQKGPAKTLCLCFVWINSICSEVHGDMFSWSHHALGHIFLQWHVLQLSCISGMETVGSSCRFITWIQIGTCTDKSQLLYFGVLYLHTPSSFTIKDLHRMKLLCCEILVSYYFQ